MRFASFRVISQPGGEEQDLGTQRLCLLVHSLNFNVKRAAPVSRAVLS